MKSFKKVVALVLSLVMVLSCMAVTVSAETTPSKTKKSINAAKVDGGFSHYTGKQQAATSVTVTLDGKTLTAGKDYTVTVNAGGTNSGEYKVTVQGIGDYEGTASGVFTITGAAKTTQKTTVKATTSKTVSAKTYKKKAKSFKLTFKPSKNNKSTKVTYKVTKGNKKTRKGITVKYSKKKGKLTVKMPKGTKKGTYKIKVTLPAYNKSKKVTKVITIKVK